jgi:L-ascorbate metabolism protein UlaG (beta-lactamase superfamily)
MQIQWFGHSCFRITAKNDSGEVSIVTDPFGEKYGLKVPKLTADVLTISHQHQDHNNTDTVKGDPFIITNPGEYETKGVFVYGIPGFHDNKQGSERGVNTIYNIRVEDLTIVHLGDLGHPLTNEQLEMIQNVDILCIPVGGTYTINAQEAIEVITQIDPRIVIPMHYMLPGLKLSQEIDGVEKFISASGLPVEKMPRLKITKKELPQDSTKLIILEA